jgi:hypothetical protein
MKERGARGEAVARRVDQKGEILVARAHAPSPV